MDIQIVTDAHLGRVSNALRQEGYDYDGNAGTNRTLTARYKRPNIDAVASCMSEDEVRAYREEFGQSPELVSEPRILIYLSAFGDAANSLDTRVASSESQVLHDATRIKDNLSLGGSRAHAYRLDNGEAVE